MFCYRNINAEALVYGRQSEILARQKYKEQFSVEVQSTGLTS